MATRKVFIVNRSCHNFSAAKKFGELVFMTEGQINRYAISEVFRAFDEPLNNSHVDDYLLVSGMSTMLVVASSILANKHGRINLLLYKNGRYLERTVMLEGGFEL
ncbi:hypothetical protein KAR91_22085 [Candidatus Pacearchaeota archaeon]|nr:hypothetical protein [Candidatus Pacearchaeota archaeon]